MKKLTIFLLFSTALFTETMFAQQSAVRFADEYQFGSVSIRVPAPDGFVDTFPRFARLRARFTIGQAATNSSVLAVHVPEDTIKELEKSEDISLGYYSRVSVHNNARTRDTSAIWFRDYVATFEKEFGKNFDEAGPVLTSVASTMRKGLNKLYETETGIDFKKPTNLGYFQKEPRIFSGMILMPVEIYGQVVPVLSAFSFVHVKERVVAAHFYRKMNDEKDAEILRDAAKKWTAKIIAANK